jgi:hypothetical protein
MQTLASVALSTWFPACVSDFVPLPEVQPLIKPVTMINNNPPMAARIDPPLMTQYDLLVCQNCLTTSNQSSTAKKPEKLFRPFTSVLWDTRRTFPRFPRQFKDFILAG